MRISTGMLYETGVNSIQRQTGSLLHTQQQVASGRRVLAPSDDPVAAARALEVTQAQAINTQYRTNQDNAKTSLGLEESQLAAVGDLIQSVQERAIQAGSAALSNSDRDAIAKELRARFDQLLGIANATDGTGQFLFSGYQGNVSPFSGNVATGVIYAGDDGQRALQVSASRQLPVSDSGSDVFMRIRNGNGTFVTDFAATNAGTAAIDAGNALGSFNGHQYAIDFVDVAGQINYTLTDVTAGTPASAPTPYQSGSAISFDGVNSVTISGSPNAGDQFTVSPSSSQSVFATIGRLITALETPPTAATGGSTRINSEVSHALTDLSQAQDNILRVRAAVGSRLSEVDALQGVGEDLSLQYAQTLSRLQDVDYADAITRLSREQLNLEAAQKSFMQVSGLSLFNYL